MSIYYEALQRLEKKNSNSINIQGIYSKKQKPPLILLIGGLIFLALIGFKKIMKSDKKITRTMNKSIPANINFKHIANDKLSVVKKRRFSEYVLEGIIYNKENPIAVINGKILKKDGKIDRFILRSIDVNSVELWNAEDNTILKLSL